MSGKRQTKRRFEFVRLHERGEARAAIARRLKTAPQTISRWVKSDSR